MGFRTELKSCLRIPNETCRQCLAELLGTFILVVFGDGSVAQYVLSRKELGSFLSINWSFGMGIMLGVFVSVGVSGGHINPAVSLAMAILGRLKWWKFPFYMLAQYLGAFLASACIYGVYIDALNNFDGGVRQVTGPNATAGIWATYPQEYVTTATTFFDQTFATAMLMTCILAITDPNNANPPKAIIAIAVGFTVMVIGAAYGLNCGFALNPARDLAPRIFTSVAGYGVEVFTYRNYWFWVPVVGPHLGAIIGAFIYQVFVGLHWPISDDLHKTTIDVNVQQDQKSTLHQDSNLQPSAQWLELRRQRRHLKYPVSSMYYYQS